MGKILFFVIYVFRSFLLLRVAKFKKLFFSKVHDNNNKLAY
jgi:hypothetical protein